MSIRWPILALVFFSAIGPTAVAPLAAQNPPARKPPPPKKSEIKNSKPDPNEIVLKGTLTSVELEVAHVADLQKDTLYIVTMDSRGFFIAIRIENGLGQRVAVLKGTSTFKAAESGRYSLSVTSPGGSSGQYVIRLRPVHLTPTRPGQIFPVGPGGLAIEAFLTKDDPIDKVRKKRCRTYDLQLTKNTKYVIDMISKQFDSFLRLENAFGKQLAQDDDSGGNNNARIHFTPPEDGIYRIYATTFNQKLGLFDLKVREDKKVPAKK